MASIPYHNSTNNNNNGSPNGSPGYPSPNAHHRRHSSNMRYTPYQHPRQTSAAAPGPGPNLGLARPLTSGHDAHAAAAASAEVPYTEHHNRRSLDGAMYYHHHHQQGPPPVQVRLAPTYTSQPPFGGHAAAPHPPGDARVPNPNEASVQTATTTATTATTATYPHEQYDPFVPSSAFPATPAPLVTFDGQGQYAKQNVHHLAASEYSYRQQQQQRHQQQQQVQQQYYHHPDGIQSIGPDIGVSDDAAASLIHSLFTGSNSLDDIDLSVGYTPTASLSFAAPEGTHSPFHQGIQPHHVYGQQSTTLDASAGLAAPAPYLAGPPGPPAGGLLQDMASFAPLPGADCPTPALVPPTPNTGPSSLTLHPVPLPFNEPTAANGGSHSQYNSSSEPATPPFQVPSCTGPSMFAAYDTPAVAVAGMPYDGPLGPPKQPPLPPPPLPLPPTRRADQAHTPADLVRNPTLKFPASQRAAAARAFDHVKNKPNVPIPTAFLGPPLSSAVVMKDGVQRARCLCEGCIGIGDDSGQGDGWRRLDHLWCHMRKEHFGCVVYRCTECPAAFSRNNDLKRHAATHESPLYSCDVGSCTAQYTRKDNLRRHIMQKHNQVSVM